MTEDQYKAIIALLLSIEDRLTKLESKVNHTTIMKTVPYKPQPLSDQDLGIVFKPGPITCKPTETSNPNIQCCMNNLKPYRGDLLNELPDLDV